MIARKYTLQEQAKAAEEGRHAWLDKQDFNSCPYNENKELGLYAAWRAGWRMMARTLDE